jgi:branched-chain amino acid transport system ATP-binding protein
MSENGREAVLELRDVDTHYGTIQMLNNVNIKIYPGEIVCLLGGNASGKTTTLKTILGMVVPTTGDVFLGGEKVSGLPTTEIVGKGISMVPENRRLFKRMTVRENLEIGAFQRSDKKGIQEDLERVFELFPRPTGQGTIEPEGGNAERRRAANGRRRPRSHGPAESLAHG